MTARIPVIVLACALSMGRGGAAFADGTARCWRQNTFGQLGTGDNNPTHIPTKVLTSFKGQIRTVDAIVAVLAGGNFTCARQAGGGVSCWGDNSFGQFGNWTVIGGNLAVQLGHRSSGSTDFDVSSFPVPGVANAIEIAAGNKHTCAAIVDGTIRCWGDNTHGQHGDGISGQVGTDSVAGIVGTFLGRGVAAGNQFPCGRRGTGAAACWGAGEAGQLGNSTSLSSLNPVAVTGLTNAIAVTAGGTHACAIDGTGRARCWGSNDRGQLGNGTTTPANQPVLVDFEHAFLNTVPGLIHVVGVAAGADHACAVTAFGSVSCWGGDSRGQIGNNSTTAAPFPTTVQGITDAVSVSAGAFYTCAVRANGNASCWGANDAGELGVKDAGDHLTPTPVAASVFSLPTGGTTFIALTGVVAVAAGTSPLSPTHEQTCALLATGVVRCWGDNAQGEIGDGTTVNQPRPTAVNSFAANVDPAATLHSEHVAIGTAHDSTRCDGRLMRVPMRVVVHGRKDFQPGAATAQLEAIVHRGARSSTTRIGLARSCSRPNAADSTHISNTNKETDHEHET